MKHIKMNVFLLVEASFNPDILFYIFSSLLLAIFKEMNISVTYLINMATLEVLELHYWPYISTRINITWSLLQLYLAIINKELCFEIFVANGVLISSICLFSCCFHSASPTNTWSFCQVLGFLSSFGGIGSDMADGHGWCAWASISYSTHWFDWWVEAKCSTKHVLHFPYSASPEAHYFCRKTFALCIVKRDHCLMNNKTNEMGKW